MPTPTGILCATAFAFAAITGVAQAAYPEKPVEFIVPWPPGDLEDVLTRMIANKFQETYGVPAAVVNKPGGGGGPFPGAVEVAKADADGYTVGSFVIGVPVVGPNLGIAELSPDPFDPLGIFLTYPFVIAVAADAPYSDWKGLAEYAKTHDIALGHFGDTLTPTRVTMALAKESGFEFASNAAFDALDCNTLASGDADVINTTLQLILPCLDKVKVLASIGSERLSLTPDVPTVTELAPDLTLSLWNGLFVRKDTPADAREKIIAVAKEVMASDEAKKLSQDTGALIYWMDADASAKKIETDKEGMTKINAILEK